MDKWVHMDLPATNGTYCCLQGREPEEIHKPMKSSVQDQFLIGNVLSKKSEIAFYTNEHEPVRKRMLLDKPQQNADLQMEALFAKHFTVLSREHSNAPARMSHGLITDLGVKLFRQRGKYFRWFGFSQDGNNYLYAEEALYLAEGDRLQIWDRGLPLSVQQLYSSLLNSETYWHYIIYSRLSCLGYVLRRRRRIETVGAHYRQVDSSWSHVISEQISLTCDATPIPRIVSQRETTNRVIPSDFGTLLPSEIPLSSADLMKNLHTNAFPERQTSNETIHNQFIYDGYGHSDDDQRRVANFSKRSPPNPDFVIVQTKPDQVYPTVSKENLSHDGLSQSTAVLVSVVDGSDVFFYSVKPFKIPTLSFSVANDAVIS